MELGKENSACTHQERYISSSDGSMWFDESRFQFGHDFRRRGSDSVVFVQGLALVGNFVGQKVSEVSSFCGLGCQVMGT